MFSLLCFVPRSGYSQAEDTRKKDYEKARKLLLQLEQTNEELFSLLTLSRKEVASLNKNLQNQLVEQKNFQSFLQQAQNEAASLRLQLETALDQAEQSTQDSEKLKLNLKEIESSLLILEKNLASLEKDLNRAIFLNKILGRTTIVSSAGWIVTLLIILL